MNRILNYKFQEKDEQDYKFVPKVAIGDLPLKTNLSGYIPQIYDQLTIGSCTGNATAYALTIRRAIEKLPYINPSRLWLYLKARELADSIATDSGATIRDVIKATSKFGYPTEKQWPYNIAQFTAQPPAKVAQAAIKNIVKRYEAVGQDPVSIKACLAEGYPVVLGILVFESFMSVKTAATGIVPMPKRGEANNGGHALVIVGHDSMAKQYLLVNSWGDQWGDKGYARIPEDYIHNPKLTADLWRIITV